jgi:hypothetical protein
MSLRDRIALKLCSTLAALAACPAHRPVLEDLVDLVLDTAPALDLRYGCESVDQNGFSRSARANTLRPAPCRDRTLVSRCTRPEPYRDLIGSIRSADSSRAERRRA